MTDDIEALAKELLADCDDGATCGCVEDAPGPWPRAFTPCKYREAADALRSLKAERDEAYAHDAAVCRSSEYAMKRAHEAEARLTALEGALRDITRDNHLRTPSEIDRARAVLLSPKSEVATSDQNGGHAE